MAREDSIMRAIVLFALLVSGCFGGAGPVESDGSDLEGCPAALACEGVCCPIEAYSIVCDPEPDQPANPNVVRAMGCWATCEVGPGEYLACPVP